MPKQFNNMNFLVSAKAYRDGEKAEHVESVFKVEGPDKGLYFRDLLSFQSERNFYKHESLECFTLLASQGLYLKNMLDTIPPVELAQMSSGKINMHENIPVHKPKLECKFYGGEKAIIIFKSNEELDTYLSEINDKLDGSLKEVQFLLT
jgi:hypothetical protein